MNILNIALYPDNMGIRFRQILRRDGITFFPYQEKSNLKVVSVIGLFISFFTTTFSQAEDMGFFLSVSGLIGNGYGLYSEAFEIKDPLFLYSNAIAINFLGLIGPFLLDFIISGAALPIAYLIGKSLINSSKSAFIAALLFQLTLTGLFGQTLRSQIMGILFILFSLYSALLGKWYLAGFLAAGVFLSKMPLFLIIGCVLLGLVLHARKLKVVIQLSIGFVTFALPMIAIMSIRGEFIPYLMMVKENFIYASNYQSIVGQNPGLLGHFLVWNGSESRFISFFASTIVIIVLAYRERLLASQLFFVVISINVSVAIFLLYTAMWPHHLQVISLYVFGCCLFLLNSIQSKFVQNNSNSGKLIGKKSQVSFDLRAIAMPMIVLIMLISNSGATLPSKPAMSIKTWFQPNWSVPAEIQMLDIVSSKLPESFSFARLGMNDDMGLGAFIKPQWKFVCKRLAIMGFESSQVIGEFLDCLRTQPSVILIAPFYESQSQRIGIYQEFFAKSRDILLEDFECSDFANGFRYCLRKI